jgi:hypothetical protein
MSQTGFDRFAFAAILFMNNHFGPGCTRAIRGFVGRAVIHDQDIVEFLARPTNDVANVLLLVVSGYDRRDLWFVH